MKSLLIRCARGCVGKAGLGLGRIEYRIESGGWASGTCTQPRMSARGTAVLLHINKSTNENCGGTLGHVTAGNAQEGLLAVRVRYSHDWGQVRELYRPL